MATNYPVNPRVRAYGKARIDIARRAQGGENWDRLWKAPTNPFPFSWGERWKQCVEYKVDDFAAEVGFFIDILGLPINAFDPDYAMFTSPGGDFFFAVIPTPDGVYSTPPDALRLQFLIKDILSTTQELERRGIEFEQRPQPVQEGASLYIGYFRTPHGICVDLWGTVEAQPYKALAFEEQKEADELDDEADDLFDELDENEEEFFPGLKAKEEAQPSKPARSPLLPPDFEPINEDREEDDDELGDKDEEDVQYVDIDEP